MASRKKKQPEHKWWLPFLSESDQEIERGRFLYDAIAEESGDVICFAALLDAADNCMKICRKLDPEDDAEKWLFYAAFFHGAGMLIRERITHYQKKKEK